MVDTLDSVLLGTLPSDNQPNARYLLEIESTYSPVPSSSMTFSQGSIKIYYLQKARYPFKSLT